MKFRRQGVKSKTFQSTGLPEVKKLSLERNTQKQRTLYSSTGGTWVSTSTYKLLLFIKLITKTHYKCFGLNKQFLTPKAKLEEKKLGEVTKKGLQVNVLTIVNKFFFNFSPSLFCEAHFFREVCRKFTKSSIFSVTSKNCLLPIKQILIDKKP